MPVPNLEVAAVFNEIAELLTLQDANPFRIRAYRNAARMLSELGRNVSDMHERGEDLDALPGIGPDLAGKIAEVLARGSCTLLDQLRQQLPSGLSELLRLPQLGPKRVQLLHQQLGVDSVAALRRAGLSGRLAELKGFGPKLRQRLLAATQDRPQQAKRYRLDRAEAIAAGLLTQLRAMAGVERAEAAGSLRRRRDSIGDLDLLVQAHAREGRTLIEAFVRLPDVGETLAAGATRASVLLRNGMQVDLRVLSADSFGAAWLYFTGSKAHNIGLRSMAQQRGLKINEYGVYKSADEPGKSQPKAGLARMAGADEASVYASLGLAWITPELREDRGELAAAQQGRLPLLIALADLRGDLHAHSQASDGQDSLEVMAEAARARGLQYLAITEHSPRLALTHGLDANRLAQQRDRIAELNQQWTDFKLLRGIEVDILEDGSLDLPDSALAELDLVVGAIHHRLDLTRERQTERLLRAMDQRYFSILAHPTGRLLEQREAYDIDLQRVLRKARERACFVELNAQPARLDLNDLACQMAKSEGVLVSINSDAHGRHDFNHLRFGIDQARRAWLTPADVLNTRSLAELMPLLQASMSRPAEPLKSP
ncbi:DNA polymerase/3'-5' exonuclease PolX [Roseateles oligotrophus]|uniref:DNA polymerase beta n=1 Tax=Roseateles oligotrophus TaxID=1769250 RepID=A0ABT2YIN4_9BURK|nr:DNA polymerase/3'-5' exonuclease PolX [Roseateles oligotrophus]MCV2369917.1 DNA polymerase/3'-5' exonuclease PolX [Roseateles oligotrophus]